MSAAAYHHRGRGRYHGSYAILPPIRVSPDGTRVLLGSGDVYDGRSLQILDSLPVDLVDAVWLADGSLVTIRDGGGGRTLVEQWSADLALYNIQYYDGTPLRVVATADEIVVVTHDGASPAFALYVPTDDGDGDGVVNRGTRYRGSSGSRQARDGIPMPGMPAGSGDSTRGWSRCLPLDSACSCLSTRWRQPDSATRTRITSDVPAQIVEDEDGIIYC